MADNEGYINYIPRKDRKRRGKREKTGRILEGGIYYPFDEDVLKYYMMYKTVTRGVKYGIRSGVEVGISSASTILSGINTGVSIVTNAVIGGANPIISSDQIPDISKGSISFSGGGYNCAFHLGVVKYIFDNPSLFKDTIYLGASGGAGISAIVVAYQDDDKRFEILESIIDTVIKMGAESISLSEQVEKYTQTLLNYIDEERFERYIKGKSRLMISLTDVSNYYPSNHVVSEFRSLDHLESVIRASACVPILLDNQIRRVDNRSYLDGGFSNNLPVLDQNTIRISCLNYPTLQAEIYPDNYLSLMTCFIHPGEDAVLKMADKGYVAFSEYMKPYIERRIDTEIKEIENKFIIEN